MLILRYPSEWIAEAAAVLARLADRPSALFVVLLAVNSLVQPYAGITHDARLYSVQVLNHVEDGAYADDLFFRYGSQDQYSLFSNLAAPFVRGLGLPLAFFVIYLVSKSLFIFGLMRLVQTLVPNRVAATVALIYCMASTIHYGGQHMLNVQENFVTPRILGCGLVLIGLDLVLRGCPVRSGLVIVFAVAIHPLMAFGGLLIWASFHLWKYAGLKSFVAATLGAAALAAVVLSVEPLGQRCFGAMDDAWRQTIVHVSSFNFVSLWHTKDWCYLAFQLAILCVAIRRLCSDDADKTRFLIVLLLVTLAGTVGSILADNLPYALLLQGQPYRILWMLALLHFALAVWLGVEWCKQTSVLGQLTGCAMLAYLCCIDGIADECGLPLLLFPLVAVGLRGLEKTPRHPAWLIQSIQLSLVLGALGWSAYKFAILVHGSRELVVRYAEYLYLVEVILVHVGPIVVLVGLCWLLVRFTAKAPGRSPLGTVVMAAGCLGVQTLFFTFPQTEFYAQQCTLYRADLRTVHEIVHRERGPGRTLPTIYCNLGCVDYVWLDLHSQSYFDWWQGGNFMFRRKMALEGQRRARVVGPFEVARFRKTESLLTAGAKEDIARFFETDFDRGPICQDDLARLCQEPGLDYVVLEEHVKGVNAVTVGRVNLYSCKVVRSVLHLPEPSSAVHMASK
jgi:hypothetical protein